MVNSCPLLRCTRLVVFVIAAIAATSCNLLEKDDTDRGPNVLGGSVDIELTKVGGTFSLGINDVTHAGEFSDDVKITRNDNGIVTLDVKLVGDSRVRNALDSMLGTRELPLVLKNALIDKYKSRFNATLDTSDPSKQTITLKLKLKVTSEGLQEFVTTGSESKPFTIGKYSMNVGDEWNIVNVDGETVRRKVVHKSTTDDHPLAFWLIKVLKIEERTDNDPLLEKVTYFINHKFGLVGVEILSKTGSPMSAYIFPPNLN